MRNSASIHSPNAAKWNSRCRKKGCCEFIIGVKGCRKWHTEPLFCIAPPMDVRYSPAVNWKAGAWWKGSFPGDILLCTTVTWRERCQCGSLWRVRPAQDGSSPSIACAITSPTRSYSVLLLSDNPSATQDARYSLCHARLAVRRLAKNSLIHPHIMAALQHED